MSKVKTPQRKKPTRRKKKNRTLLYFSIGILLIFIAAGVLFMQYVIEGLPSLDELENPQAQLASNVYSSDGELIGQFFKENRVEVKDPINGDVTLGTLMGINLAASVMDE